MKRWDYESMVHGWVVILMPVDLQWHEREVFGKEFSDQISGLCLKYHGCQAVIELHDSQISSSLAPHEKLNFCLR
jgi:hypothetical protein